MKYLMLLSVMMFSSHVFASAECAGIASSGELIKVRIDTTGLRGMPQGGEVTIVHNGNSFGYKFGGAEISQYFELDESETIVGIRAYLNGEKQLDNPLFVSYTGQNFADMDLGAVIEGAKSAAPQEKEAILRESNVLRVWKGTGFAATEQYQATGVVCAVWSSI
ncbi:MAG: hypothetical protein AB7G93_06240 [Bdellovibrionales bacterium]